MILGVFLQALIEKEPAAGVPSCPFAYLHYITDKQGL